MVYHRLAFHLSFCFRAAARDAAPLLAMVDSTPDYRGGYPTSGPPTCPEYLNAMLGPRRGHRLDSPPKGRVCPQCHLVCDGQCTRIHRDHRGSNEVVYGWDGGNLT